MRLIYIIRCGRDGQLKPTDYIKTKNKTLKANSIMTENKKRKPYIKPSMEVIKVETTSILAGSGPPNSISGYEDATDENGGWFEGEATE